MATKKEAERAKEKKMREPGRMRREKKRMEAQMRDRRRAVSRGVDMSIVLIALLTTQGVLLVQEKGDGSRLLNIPVMKEQEVAW